MLGLFSFAASISYLAYWYCSSLIRRRLHEVDDGTVKSLLIFNQPHNLKRYWLLAQYRHWSRVPVFGVCVAFLCGFASCIGVIAILIFHKT
jgi:hypothetical protein